MGIKDLKMEVAEILQVDEVNASNLFTLANSNEQLLKAIQSATNQSTNNFNLRTIEAWKLLRNELHQLPEQAKTKSLPEITMTEDVNNDALQDMYAIKLPPASKKDKRYLGFNGHTVSNIENAGRWDIESARELMEELNLQNSKLIMVSSDTEPTVTEQPDVPDVSEVITEVNQTTFEVINQPIVTMPVDDPWLTEQPEVKTTVQSSVTANTTDKVEIPEQVQQPSETITKPTETTSSKVDEMPNSYSFAFQETKLPINVLEVHSNNGKKIEVINLTDAYFIELRDNKLYISYGLNIKTFSSDKHRILKAFNSLKDASNVMHLRDLREANRDILINKLRVKTIKYEKDKIVFYWNGWLTVPGIHRLVDWQVID